MISVITINFNGAKTLARTCKSVTAQSIDFEWVVVDGQSTDGSQSIISNHLRKGDRFISEPDHGISDAMNKGISMCTGDSVLFMNAGDEFVNCDSLLNLYRVWNRETHRWIIGGAEIVSADGRPLFIRTFSQTPTDPLSLVRTNCQIVHQAVLAELSLFKDWGGYDDRWRIAMDYDLWIRWLKRGVTPQMTPTPVCRFHRGGTSCNPMRNHREWQAIRTHHGINNGFATESMLTCLAWIKTKINGRYGRWVYRLKEHLGVRL